MKLKTITHVFAAILAGAVAFAVSPAGQALVRQYPKLAAVVGIITALGAVYHDPKQD
jgi:hypothetical protein